jgi:putative membrane protein
MNLSSQPFSEPTRQSILAIALIIVKYIRVIIRQIWPLLLILVVGKGKNIEQYIGIALAVIGLVSMVWAILSYFRFYFYLDEDELIIEKGVLRKTKLNIPFDRIQTINFQQNLLHQFLQVIELEIDTAGSKGTEFSIDALSKDQAELLREVLLSKKAEAKQENKEDSPLEVEWQTELEEEKELVLQLFPLDLLKIGISQNHFKSFGLILFFLFWLQDSLDDFGLPVGDYYENAYEYGLKAGLMVLLILAILVTIVSFLISLIRTVIQYFDLRFWRIGSRFKLVSGLFTRREASALDNKIQVLTWSNNPLKKLFGYYDVQLKQASSVQITAKKSIRIPGCFRDQVDFLKNSWLGHDIWREMKLEQVSIHYLYRRILYSTLFTSLGAITCYYFDQQVLMVFFIFLIPYFILTSILSYKKMKFGMNDEVVYIGKGMFGNQHAILPIYKIQSVKLKQTPYQYRRNLASLVLYIASGKLTIPYIPLELAEKINDYFLYRVESDFRHWM